MRRITRFAFACLAVLLGGPIIRLAVAWDRLRGRAPLQGAARRCQRDWCRIFCAVFGIRRQRGVSSLTDPPALLAVNHVSWLDIVVLAAEWPVAFLSKSEVARWPVIGGVATGLGTIYIRRGGPSAAREATERMTQRLSEGGYVVFFPEGTTGDGVSLRAFRPRLFQAAIEAGAPVQPLGIAYSYPDGSYCDRVPFTDDSSLAGNVWSLAAVPALLARLEPGRAIDVAGKRRDELASTARDGLREALGID